MQKQRRRRSFPFYKVQVFDIKLGTWKDQHKAFDTLESAKAYIEAKVAPERARIMLVKAAGRSVLSV